jgi:hypothetical protein
MILLGTTEMRPLIVNLISFLMLLMNSGGKVGCTWILLDTLPSDVEPMSLHTS